MRAIEILNKLLTGEEDDVKLVRGSMTTATFEELSDIMLQLQTEEEPDVAEQFLQEQRERESNRTNALMRTGPVGWGNQS